MAKDSGHKLTDLAVDGGMSNSDICMQVCTAFSNVSKTEQRTDIFIQSQADIIQIPVERPSMHETTALGAAIAAGFASGIWSTYDELRHMNRANRSVFKPYLDAQESALMYKQWTKAVEMSRGWLDASEIGMDEDEEEAAGGEEPSHATHEAAEHVVQVLQKEESDNSADDVAVGSESD